MPITPVDAATVDADIANVTRAANGSPVLLGNEQSGQSFDMQTSIRHATTIGVFLMLSAMHSQPATAQSKLVKTAVTYREVDGHEILADVHRPQDKDVRPVIVWIHGGALIVGHREGLHDRVKELAEEQGLLQMRFVK